MGNCFFEFEITNEEKFRRMQDFFYAIKESKMNESISCTDSKWINYFDKETLLQFWWPSTDELNEYAKLWEETPFESRFTDPKLQHPWDFESMIEAFANGEYELISCEKTDVSTARLEYYPWSWPYGGSECFKALIEYHGFIIIREDI